MEFKKTNSLVFENPLWEEHNSYMNMFSNDNDVFQQRHWQKIAFEKLKDARYFLIQAVCGCGKSMFGIWMCMHHIIKSNFNKKTIIIVPQSQIAKSFISVNENSHLCLEYNNEEWIWMVSHNICERNKKGEELRKFILKPPVKPFNLQKNSVYGSNCVTTHQNFIQVWNKLTEDEKKIAIKDTTIIIDECHHSSVDEDNNESTLLGKVFHEILSFNEETCNIGLMTATFFRSDWKKIVPDQYKEYFIKNKFVVRWDEHYKTLGIKEFFFDFIMYDENPISHIIQKIKDEPNEHHLIILPRTKSRFRDENTLSEYIEEITKIIPIDKVLDVVTESGREQKFEQLNKNRTAYNVIIACSKFDEGTDWPPCNRLYFTSYGESITRQHQVFGRVFRKYKDKKDVKIYCYLENRKDNDLRGKLSTYFNALLTTMMVEDLFVPIKIPKLSPIVRDKVPKDNISLYDLLDEKYNKFKEYLFSSYDRLSIEEKNDPVAVRSVIDAISKEYYNTDFGVRYDDFNAAARGLIVRANSIRSGTNTFKNEIDIDCLKNDFDKIWQKEKVLGCLIFGTEEPLPNDLFCEFRKLLEKNNIKDLVEYAGIIEKMDNWDECKKELDIIYLNHWVELKNGEIAKIIDNSNDFYKALVYKKATFKHGMIYLNNSYINRGENWIPFSCIDCNDLSKVPLQIRKKFLKESDLINKKEIILSDITAANIKKILL
jgi:hypothetical protein